MKQLFSTLAIVCLVLTVTRAQVTGGLIQAFSFDNTLSSQSATSSFATGTGISFTSDRNGNANAAINIVASGTTGGTQATITSLPYAATARTIAFWIKYNATATTSYILDYGSTPNNASFSFSTGAGGNNITVTANGTTADASVTNPVNTWIHYAITYDGAYVRMYRNGVPVKAQALTVNTVNATNVFTLGKTVAGTAGIDASLDDLNIYNRALTLDEINILYNSLPTPIQEYSFDNTLANTQGVNAFSQTIQGTYVNGRKGNITGALRLVGEGSVANIPNLPVGTSKRTVSFWVNFQQLTSIGGNYDFLFGYGSAATSQAWGLSHYNSQLINFGYNNDYAAPVSLSTGQWIHMAVVWGDAGLQQIYVNGNNVGSSTKTWNTANTTTFYLGGFLTAVTKFVGAFDDLKIYNTNLTAAQVAVLAQNYTDLPTINSVATNNVASTSALINYNVNANGSFTSTVVKYGTAANALSSQATGQGSIGFSNTALSTSLTNLQPNTTYYYRVEATNSLGTTASPVYSFTTTGNILLYEFKFDNSLYDATSTVAFAAPIIGYYTTNRFNTANSAYYFGTGTTATLTGLPSGNASRSISLWVKFNALPQSGDFAYIFGYGGTTNNAAYGLSAYGTNNTSLYNYGYNNDLVINPANLSVNTWYHIVTTYDGAIARIYVNGVQVGSAAKTWNTTASSTFLLAQGFSANGNFSGAIDDLKIFSTALSATQVTELYANNALPVSFTSFKGFAKGNENILQWTTATEMNNKGFYIERSTDGVRFEKLGFVAGAGNSNTVNHYTFTDNQLTAATYYYRLQQTDVDGKVTYSATISINSKASTYSLYPIPAKEILYIKGGTVSNVQAVVVNAAGVQQSVTINNNSINIAHLPAGVYQLHISSSNLGLATLPFVKQ